MVTINKNIFSNQDNGLSLSSSKKNTDELFAELFSIVNSDQNLSNLPPDKSKNNNKELYNPGNLTLVDTKVSDIEIEAAKYLAETFYKEIGIIDDKDSYQIDKVSEFATKKNIHNNKSHHNIEKNDLIKKLSIHEKKNEFTDKNNYEITVNFEKIEKTKNIKEKLIHKEKIEIGNINPKKKTEAEAKPKDFEKNTQNLNKTQLKSSIDTLIEKKNKKKNKQIFKNVISEYSETNSSNNQKIIDKPKINLLHINKRNQSENIKDIKLNEVKNNLKGPKQINSNSSEQKILNFMENNWEQKFVNIIKESIKNDINKIELDVKPKNLGKIKLEVKVEKEVTKIDFTTDNLETANLLNENLNKINDHISEGKENYLSQNRSDNQNPNQNKQNKENHNKNLVSKNKEKSPINDKNNSNHNIDVNA